MMCSCIRFAIGIAISLLFVQESISQSPPLSPEKLGYSAFSLERPELGQVNYYVRNIEKNPTQPIIIYLDGSGPYPLFQRMEQGFGSTLVVQDRQLLDKFKWVLISKPGVPFVDDVKFDEKTGVPLYDAPDEYTKRLSLTWRVQSAKAVIDELFERHSLKPEQLIVVGVSEGFQVGAKLASIEPRISRVGLFVGNGLNQFYDFVIEERMKMERGEQSPIATQSQIDRILGAVRDIQAAPDSTDKFWMGHTYLRWASFSNDPPINSLLQVKAPIFVACCAKDRNTSIVSADYIPLEFTLQKRTNLTYKVYPYEHAFIEWTHDQNGKTTGMTSHFETVFTEFVNWVETIGNP